MSNIYRVNQSIADVAAAFHAEPVPGLEEPNEVAPRHSGLVVRQDGPRRLLEARSWGFPHPTLKDKPVNLVANLTNPMWERLVVDSAHRCLIPVSQFGEPAGMRGKMTRTWFSVRDEPLAVWAGFWADDPKWGPVFAGMTTDSNEAVMPLNNRMPVLLHPHETEHWLTCGVQDVIGFAYREFPAGRLQREDTRDLWVRRGAQQGELLF